MNKLKIMLCTLVAIFGFTTVSNAASLNGVYLEVGSSAIGADFDGNHNDDDGDVSKGTLGKTAVTAHYGLGYMTNRSNKVGLDIGYMWYPGEAKVKATSDNTNTDVTFEISDSTEYYISPMINITEDASLYFKYAWNESDIKTTGDVTKLTSMDGETVALGTVMSWGSNLYIRTEAGITDYDNLSASGLGTNISTSVTVKADPTVHYGKIAIGYKF
ncbi:outer membrane beta-barrel protein [Pelagibacteraceae bacterium]|jgi:hypothetical protein|nr:outer membrane beta-barrel protein [Pelagibacteraceae bacterium]